MLSEAGADVNKAKKALKDTIQTSIKAGATWRALCVACPDFAAVAEAAETLCAKLREKALVPTCWFTGARSG